MPACVQELHGARPHVPGPDRRRRDQPQLRPAHPLPERHRVRRGLRARRLLLQGRVRGAGQDGPAGRRRGARQALIAKTREAAKRLREQPEQRDDDAPPVTDASVRARPPHRQPDARAAVLGRARDRRRHGRGLPPPRHPRAVQAPLGRARGEGRGVAQAGLPRTSSRAWSGCGASRPTCTRARCSATSRATRDGNELDRLGSGRTRRDGARAPRLPAPAAPRPHLPGRLLPPARDRASPTSSRCRRSPPATRSPS